MESGQLTEEYLYTRNVEIITRRFVNNEEQKLSGFRVYANPWIRQNKLPAKITFTNSTNPGTTAKLPPGKYFIWAEPVTEPSKKHPRNIQATKVDYSSVDNVVVIYIDIQ